MISALSIPLLTIGGITGAGARITGTVGDVFAKLTFDEEFIDKRQQQKSRPPRLGSRLGGFAKVGCHSTTYTGTNLVLQVTLLFIN